MRSKCQHPAVCQLETRYTTNLLVVPPLVPSGLSVLAPHQVNDSVALVEGDAESEARVPLGLFDVNPPATSDDVEPASSASDRSQPALQRQELTSETMLASLNFDVETPTESEPLSVPFENQGALAMRPKSAASAQVSTRIESEAESTANTIAGAQSAWVSDSQPVHSEDFPDGNNQPIVIPASVPNKAARELDSPAGCQRSKYLQTGAVPEQHEMCNLQSPLIGIGSCR